MSTEKLLRWAGALVALGGIFIAAYMLVHPWAQRTGAVATSTQWLISHSLHFAGALLLLAGLFGLYFRQREQTGKAGFIAFLLAFLGTAFFVGTGMSSTFLWSAIAAESPNFVSAEGGMFKHPLAIGPVVASRILLVLGFVSFGFVSFRSGVLPRSGSLLVMMGAVLLNLPTQPVGPVPWWMSVAGAVVFCIGLVIWGYALWDGSPDSHDAPLAFLKLRKLVSTALLGLLVILFGGWISYSDTIDSCFTMVGNGLLKVAEDRSDRFLGKVQLPTANCRGGDIAEQGSDSPWVDWRNYFGTGDGNTKSRTWLDPILPHRLERNGRGLDGALLDLEYQRLELIQFNLFDNTGTFEDYVRGRAGSPGAALRYWPELSLRSDHPNFGEVGGAGEQVCSGDLIRARTLTGICNDVRNPAMGSTGQPFARNVPFEATFPRLGLNALVRNRHGDRLGLLKPDPQVISRKLFTRPQSDPAACREGQGLPGDPVSANCDYAAASFFNVLSAFWIQFMTHDWFSHMVEGQNQPGEMMAVGCPEDQAEELGCRPGDRIDRAMMGQDGPPDTFSHDGKEHLSRAPRVTNNNNTAWWDASQIYGYDETSIKRVKRDPADPAKLLQEDGYLPTLGPDDPQINQWRGQEAVAFPDNFNIGLSFYHNVFVREHNLFVDAFRDSVAAHPNMDSGLRRPANPKQALPYSDVTDQEIFDVARLVVAAEIAKVHTIEWTTQLLYNDPLYEAMNSNWSGLFNEGSKLARISERLRQGLAESRDPKKANLLVSIFASGSGIVGMGNNLGKDWDISNPDDLNRGVTHFGSPFNFPEEFVTVYRLHPLVPDLIEMRDLQSDPNEIRNKVPILGTVRAGATQAMHEHGIDNWALSMGRQRLGGLFLNNHPQFLQNIELPRLASETGKIDVAALDLIRDRERGIPRFNEFRRQYGLRYFRSFEELAGPEFGPQLREIYGTHTCDDSKVITDSQKDREGNPVTDCLGLPDGSTVDNIEDVDTVVGWLAEVKRPHGFAISETQFQVFIINASRRLFSDRFFTSSFRPEIYSSLGYNWVSNNGPNGKQYEAEGSNGHEQEVSPMKRILLRTIPALEEELAPVINVFDPWARDRGEHYCLDWKPRAGAESDPSFSGWESNVTCSGQTDS